MSTKTITLSSPIDVNGQSVNSLTFREATVGDLMVSGRFKDEMSQTIAVLASIADTPLPAFQKIKARDLKRILAETADLLGNDQPMTGE